MLVRIKNITTSDKTRPNVKQTKENPTTDAAEDLKTSMQSGTEWPTLLSGKDVSANKETMDPHLSNIMRNYFYVLFFTVSIEF